MRKIFPISILTLIILIQSNVFPSIPKDSKKANNGSEFHAKAYKDYQKALTEEVKQKLNVPGVYQTVISYATTLTPKEKRLANQQLFKSIRRGDIPGIKMAIAQGADINNANDKGISAILLAIQRGNLEVLKFLIDAGADVNKTIRTKEEFDAAAMIPYFRRNDVLDLTPLFYSIYEEKIPNRIEVVRLLLNNGANPNSAGNNRRDNPLKLAVIKRNMDRDEKTEIITMLLERGVDPSLVIGEIEEYEQLKKSEGYEDKYLKEAELLYEPIVRAYNKFKAKKKAAIVKEVKKVPEIAAFPPGIFEKEIAGFIDAD